MAKLIDLTGKKFYEWTVIRKAPAKNGRTMWECVCSCGKTGLVGGYDLKNGKHKSCGHDRKRNIKDLAWKVFGELTVLEYIGDSKWKCKCSCGETIQVNGYDLTTGHTKSCGHGKNKFIDLTGQTFGEWEVLGYAGNHFWNCRCSCGEIKNVHSYSLRSGGSKSCGHNRESSKLENLAGKKFNEWEVLSYVGDSKWKCKCSCGVESVVGAYDLKNGKSKNCGHNKSKPCRDLTGMTFGQLEVLEYLSGSIYRCRCSCGKETKAASFGLLSGERVSCGCKNKSIYTEEYIRKVIEDYTAINNQAPYIADLANELNITVYYVNKLVKKYGLRNLINTTFRSRYERDIYNVIKVANPEIDIKKEYRSILNNKELDLYIPSKKLAIEFNGDYWHNASRLGSKYHQDKTIECAKRGIQLIHIFQHEWLDSNKREKLMKLIENKISTNNLKRVYARNCEVRVIGVEEERRFLDNYHLQNYAPSRVAYGLYIGDELVSLMTFGIPRFSNVSDWELVRYCTNTTVAVIGGAEKLFKHFIREYNPSSIVSYCDISKFFGGVYTKLGFETTKDSLTAPNYKWVKYGNNKVDILTRYQTQKQRLINLGYGIYGNTEDEIMTNMGYLKLYDSGNLRLTWSKK